MKTYNLKAPPDMAQGRAPLIPVSEATDDVTNTMTRQTLEIAYLKARIQHLDLVVETARSLMGGNQERLLRRLHEVPRELVELSAQLRRLDPQAGW